MKCLIIASVFLMMLNIANSQAISTNKNQVRIGIYVYPVVTLHTKLVTDLSLFYVEEEKRLSHYAEQKDSTFIAIANGKRPLVDYQKMRRDSIDAFERLFTNVAVFLSLAVNGSSITYERDTFFMPFIKMEAIENGKIAAVMARDSLDYLVAIQDFHSTETDGYYNIEFTIKLFPKNVSKGTLVQQLSVSFTDKQKDPNSLLHCSKPFECLIANITGDCMRTITGKLIKDGYCKQLKEEFEQDKP